VNVKNRPIKKILKTIIKEIHMSCMIYYTTSEVLGHRLYEEETVNIQLFTGNHDLCP